MMSLRELLNCLQIVVAEDCEINSISLDSRAVGAGTLFCAYPGSQVDGRDFIAQAQNQGAAAVVYEATQFKLPETIDIPAYAVADLQNRVGVIAAEFYRKPSSELQVFGVTGTNGKTTCATLLVQAFELLGLRAAMIGTLGSGALEQLSYAGQTTPDPISLQKILREYADAGVTQVCMEVSSHALSQGRVAGVEFFCTLFTNLSRDHLDYHGDMQNYFAAKQSLFSAYKSDLSVVNVADQYGLKIIDSASSEFLVSYGFGGDVFAEEVHLKDDGIALEIEGNGVSFDVSTSLVGAINVPNLELLIATLLALSTPVEQVIEICHKLKPAPGRMELYKAKNGASIVIDYAHTPDALEKSLGSVREHCVGKLVCVFGCGGDRDTGKRPVMGAAADELADVVIVTNDNPRSEAPRAIAAEIVCGIKGEHQIELDRAIAINMAITQAQADDWVLIAGKGHETTQEINGQVLEFSDRQYVQSILEAAA